MRLFTKFALGSLLALAMMVPAASARPRVIVRGGFGGFYGPAYYGGLGPGWWGPGWYDPYYGGYYVAPQADTGSVKIETHAKDAMVYVDGGYAGTVGNLKTFSLKTGQHDLELRDPSGHAYFQERINSFAGQDAEAEP